MDHSKEDLTTKVQLWLLYRSLAFRPTERWRPPLTTMRNRTVLDQLRHD
jgi:hypothetical protein